MAGIHVSGGVFSGSGDLTADWFWAEYNTAGTGRVYLPDGTFTLTGERSNLAFAYQWQGSSDYLYHQSGTVKITYGGGTQVNTDGAAPVNATTGRKGQFYDLIVDQGSNPRTTDPVLLVTRESSANYMGIENSLTIISGTARIGDTDVTNTTKIGHVYIGASGTFSAGDVTTVNNAGYNNWDSSGSISVKSVLFNGVNGVFVANGGTIEVLGPYSGNDSDHYVWENNLKGTVYHNNGTIQFGGVGLLSIGQTSENATYNNYKNNDRPADGTGQSSNGDGGYLYNMSVGFRDGDSPSRHLGLQAVSNILVGNDLTVLTSGGIDKSSYGSTVSGSVTLLDDAYWGNYAAQGGTNNWGRLYMGASYFKAPTGTLVLNKNIGGYTMYNPDGTFVHNNGNVAIEFDNTDATQVRNNSDFYNYEQTLTAAAHRVNWRGKGSAPYAFTIANNATIKEGSFRPTAPTNTMVISGTLEVQDGGNYGYVAGDFEVSSSIGAIDIKSGGNMYASTDRTTVTTNSFTDAGTFHHNSGTVVMQGVGKDIDGTSTTTFYNLTSETYIDVTKSINVENTMKALGSNSWRFVTNQTITMGTATGSGRIEVGTASSKGMRFTNLNKTYKFEAASEAYPWIGISSGAGWNNGEPGNTIELTGCDMQFAFNTQGSGGDSAGIWKVANAKFEDVTVESGAFGHDTLIVSSGQTATFGGNLSIAISGMIVSGALVNMEGAGNWSETGYQPHIGRATASLMWNSTGYYSPNGGYLNNGWKNVFWNADARINQDGPFRNSNLIVAKQFSASNRPIGSTTESQMLKSIRVLNGGTVSSSTNVFKIQNTGTFNTRGGLFASSSAVDGNGTDTLITLDSEIASDTTSTVEFWINPDATGWDMILGGTSNNRGYYYYGNGITIGHAGGYTYLGAGSIPLDKWSNVVITNDGGTATLYVDGKIIDTGAVATPPTQKYIGGDVNYDAERFDGRIGRVSVWSKALTGAEIRTMMFQDFDAATTTTCVGWWQFDEGEGLTVADKSTSGNDGTLNSNFWATAGNWNANTLSGAAHTGKLYIGTGVTPTVFTNSTFELDNRELIVGSKFASKSHKGTTEYYIATSGTNDWLNYQKIEEAAPIGALNDVKILANGSDRSYFNFDSNANNEQCNTLVNAGYVRIVDNADFYTQDFDNSQGVWERGPSYDGIIHDDGSTPHEYEPIDLMDDQDSYFDTEELID